VTRVAIVFVHRTLGKLPQEEDETLWINGRQYPFDVDKSSSKLQNSINIIIYHRNISNTMPELQISVEDEQKAFEADVAAIEKQWSSARQSHLKRYVNFASCYKLIHNRVELISYIDHTLQAL
jgi:hypothetical protein